jgi:Zn-dependent protease
MFNKSMKVARVFGIDINLHYSWWLVFFFLSWALATSFFPFYFQGFSTFGYWLMGITASILLFISVLLHELSHSLVAKSRNIGVKSITLFFFGGVAGITKEDMKPFSEFIMAIAGPLFSLFLAGIFLLIFNYTTSVFWIAITFYLYQLNFILALFNLVPAFPLDGGRAFRAILYWHYKDLRKATRIAAKGGKIFGAVLVILGVIGLFTNQGPGLWFILLGGFLYFIAKASYEQVVIKSVLEKIPVKTLLDKKYPLLSPKLKFLAFLKKYENGDNDFFLVKDKKFLGILDVNSLGNFPNLPLSKIAIPIKSLNLVREKDNCYIALQKLAEQKVDFLPVGTKGNIKGIISRKKLMKRLVWDLKFRR